jgi:hypothetical protein
LIPELSHKDLRVGLIDDACAHPKERAAGRFIRCNRDWAHRAPAITTVASPSPNRRIHHWSEEEHQDDNNNADNGGHLHSSSHTLNFEETADKTTSENNDAP